MLKSFSVPSQGQKHILSLLPLLQGSLPKNKGSSGNNFSRRIFQRGLENHSSSKTSLFLKKKTTPEIFLKNVSEFFFSVENWKIANRLKRVLPKFRANPSHVRGVNGRSKFRKKIEIHEWFFEKVTSAIRTAHLVQFLCYVTFSNANSRISIFFRNFERPFTHRTKLGSARNLGKTRFERFATFHCSTPKMVLGN